MGRINIRVAFDIDASVDEVWAILGGFDGLPAISSATAASRLEEQGRVRVLTGRTGAMLWERLTKFDEAKRLLTYEIIDAKACEGMAYGLGYRGQVQVLSRRSGRGATFVYRASFLPTSGVSDKVARAAVVDFAADCALGVRRVLAHSL